MERTRELRVGGVARVTNVYPQEYPGVSGSLASGYQGTEYSIHKKFIGEAGRVEELGHDPIGVVLFIGGKWVRFNRSEVEPVDLP